MTVLTYFPKTASRPGPSPEPEVEDERGMGWPHHDGQGGIHDRLLDPCGGPALIAPEAS